MKKVTILLILVVLSQKGYPVDIDFSWSLCDIGFEYVNRDNSINLGVNALRFNWIETETTGLGLSLGLVNYHGFEDETYFALKSILNPSVIIDKFSNCFNFGVYDRINWNGGRREDNLIFYNALGAELSYSVIPFGRLGKKINGKYNANISVFFEYQSNNTFRTGVSMDVLMLFLPFARINSAKKEEELISYSIDELQLSIDMPDMFVFARDYANENIKKAYSEDDIQYLQKSVVVADVYLAGFDGSNLLGEQYIIIRAIEQTADINLNLFSYDELIKFSKIVKVLWDNEEQSKFKKIYRSTNFTFLCFTQENKQKKIYKNIYYTHVKDKVIIVEFQTDNARLMKNQIALYERVLNTLKLIE